MKANKRSRFGKLILTALARISGADVIGRSFSGVAANAAGSARRIGGLAKSLYGSKNEKKPPVKLTGDESQRFAAAMLHYQVDDTRLAQMIRNTGLCGWLYLALLVLGLALGALSLQHYPPDSIGTGLFRFLAVPVLGALSFKHCYLNWMYRHRKLGAPVDFFRSGDLLPKLSST